MARPRGKKRGPKGRPRSGWGARALRWALRGAVVAALALAGLAFAAWPDVDRIAKGPVTSSAFIEAFVRETNRRPPVTWRDYERIDDDLKLAVLVAEDARFFEHGPFDPRELGAAISDRLFRDRRLRGASTLTQQLAKNLWLSPRRSVPRKLREALCAVALERRLDKHRILELYLNVVELGPGVFGAEAAAQRFFDRGADDLEPEQAAQLAATLSRPSRWYPGVSSEAYARRVQHILQEMKRSPGVRRALAR